MDLIKDLSKDEILLMFNNAVDSLFEGLDDKIEPFGDEPLPIAIDTTTIESDAEWKRVTIESIADPEDSDWSKRKRRTRMNILRKRRLSVLLAKTQKGSGRPTLTTRRRWKRLRRYQMSLDTHMVSNVAVSSCTLGSSQVRQSLIPLVLSCTLWSPVRRRPRTPDRRRGSSRSRRGLSRRRR